MEGQTVRMCDYDGLIEQISQKAGSIADKVAQGGDLLKDPLRKGTVKDAINNLFLAESKSSVIHIKLIPITLN